MIRRYSQWVTVVVALFLLVAGGFYTRYQMQAQASKMVPVKIETQPDPDVTVVSAQSGSYAAKITAYGEATPHFELSLTAQVSGQVVSLDDNFEPGKRVKKGTVLVQLEDSEYQAVLASAKKDLADARLTLLEEERQAQQASSEWSASGLDGDPDSDLVLRKPQLTAARAAVTNAEAALASARKDLAQTRITVPFDALVVERQVAPGS
ncbi:MAG: biotin/lipoyl-binding protein, partial [Desulfobacteraceae bacterium]